MDLQIGSCLDCPDRYSCDPDSLDEKTRELCQTYANHDHKTKNEANYSYNDSDFPF